MMYHVFAKRAEGNRMVEDESEEEEVVPRSFFQKTMDKISEYMNPTNTGKPKDYYYNPAHHNGKFYQPYLYLSRYCDRVVNKSENFNYFITVTICFAGIMVGLQTYSSMATNPIVDMFDFVILGIFTMECSVKIIMEGLVPYRYFTGPEWKWNCFDFTIVFLSFPFWGGLFGGGSIALLRLVRLARLGKLIRKIPALQMIVKGLAGGLSSISYIMILIFLVFYLFGVMGFYLFSVNDPFHFGSLPMSMYSLFRISTLDNWGDILYVNSFGCQYYPDVYVSEEDKTVENRIFWCDNAHGQLFLSMVYFVSFVVLSALVMLSLFIGAVTLSMTESMEELKGALEEKKKKQAFENNKKRMLAMKKASPASSPGSRRTGIYLPELKSGGVLSPSDFGVKDRPESPSSVKADSEEDSAKKTGEGGDGNDEDGDGDDDDDDDFQTSAEKLVVVKEMANRNPIYWIYMKYLEYLVQRETAASEENKAAIGRAMKIAMGEDVDASKSQDTDGQKADGDHFHLGERRNSLDDVKEKPNRKRKSIFVKYYLFISDLCKRIISSSPFNNFMTFVILLASINVGAQTDDRVMGNPQALMFITYLDTTILMFFTVEVFFKMIGEGLQPMNYFKDGWNKFDFLIVAGSYVPGAGSTVTILRLLRLLRVLKLVKRFPQLAVIVNALIMSLSSIGYVGLVLFLFFYVFAIMAMMLFSTNDPWHFGQLHLALISLFRIATLDSAADVTYVNMFGCDQYGGIYDVYPDLCTDPSAHGLIAAIFFILFTIIGAQVLLSLFIGVISTSMDQARENQKQEQRLEEKLEKTAAKLSLSRKRMDAFKTVFSLLDLDGGGTIDEEELKIGLGAIDAGMSDDQIIAILRNVDPEGNGVDTNGFIDFMCQTPFFKTETTAALAIGFLKKNSDHKQKREPWHQFLTDLLYYGGKANRIEAMRIEAAFTIQDAWYNYKAVKEARAVSEKKKRERLEQKRIEAEKIAADNHKAAMLKRQASRNNNNNNNNGDLEGNSSGEPHEGFMHAMFRKSESFIANSLHFSHSNQEHENDENNNNNNHNNNNNNHNNNNNNHYQHPST